MPFLTHISKFTVTIHFYPKINIIQSPTQTTEIKIQNTQTKWNWKKMQTNLVDSENRGGASNLSCQLRNKEKTDLIVFISLVQTTHHKIGDDSSLNTSLNRTNLASLER